MKYTLYDKNTNQIINIIEWDGESQYDPSPYGIRPWQEGDAMPIVDDSND